VIGIDLNLHGYGFPFRTVQRRGLPAGLCRSGQDGG
jgi:hypothetical protein